MTFKHLFTAAAAVLGAGLLAVSASASAIRIEYIEDTDVPAAIELPSEHIALFTAAELPSYSSDYGYRSFAEMENGEAWQALYRQFDAAAQLFHYDYTLDAPANDVVVELNYASAGLDFEDAIAIWDIYKLDHPLYYWISNTVQYSDTSLFVLTEDLYDTGAERESCNLLIAEKIADYLALTEGETSAYRIAMAYHDTIIDSIDYAYKADGVTPEEAIWAHNIMGVMEEKGGVCESYARTFQLMLNAAGVENILVTGWAGSEPHVWNLVRFDNGGWYWCDLTWDDYPVWMWGIDYTFFGVNDTQIIGGGVNEAAYSFMDKHYCNTVNGGLGAFLYPLPARSDTPYQTVGSELLYRDVFTEGMFSCMVVGYNAVQITGINSPSADVAIPEIITYQGTDYTVVSLGGIDALNDNSFGGSMQWQGTAPETISIPGTVRYIWPFTFAALGSVREVSVDAGNMNYCAEKGVIYGIGTGTKTLLCAVDKSITYTVIPADVMAIADQAFFGCTELKDVYFLGDAPTEWGEGIFTDASSELILHYVSENTSGWTAPAWTAPDGVTYRTEETAAEEIPDIQLRLPGDCNGDGSVDSLDVDLLFRYVIGFETREFTADDLKTFDVNTDGSVDSIDVDKLFRYVIGYDSVL